MALRHALRVAVSIRLAPVSSIVRRMSLDQAQEEQSRREENTHGIQRTSEK